MLPQWLVHYWYAKCLGPTALGRNSGIEEKWLSILQLLRSRSVSKFGSGSVLWLWLQVWKWYLEYFLKICLKPQKQAPNSGLKLNVFGSTTLFETVFRIRIRYWQTDLATLDKYLKMDPFIIKLRPCCFQSTI